MADLDFLESKAWWEEKTKPKALHPALGIFKFFADHDKNRLSAYNAYSRIYLNRDIDDSDYLANYSAAWNTEDNAYSRVPVNLAKIFIDSAMAKVTKQHPRPVFVTKGGNFTNRKKAKDMQRWTEYADHFTDVRPTRKAAALDGAIYGNGFVKTCPHPVVDEVVNERVHPADIFIDPMESVANGKPTHLYQRAYVNRTRLMKMFPSAKAKIRKAGRITDQDTYQWRRQDVKALGTVVEVIEGWRLPSYHGAGDGKHIIFVENQVLVLDDWEHDAFPFACYRWKDDPTVGFWGVSLTEELLGVHFDFNHTITNIETCIDNMPTPIIFVSDDANVSEGQLGNVNGIVINHSGESPPSFNLPPSVPADVVNYSLQIWQKGLEIARLISLSMPEVTGNGFETGQAVRDFNDIQSSELAPQYEGFERFNVHSYEAQVRAGRDIYARNPSFKIVARRDKYTIEEIDWSAIDDPRRDSFIIQVFPASMLSQTPAGRKSDVLDFFNAGWLDVGEAMSLLDFPDLDKARSLHDASRQNIERILEDMLDENLYTPPEPTMDLRLALKMGQMYLNRAQAMRAPEERVSNIRQFLRQVHALLQKSDEATRMQAEGLGPGFAGGPPAVGPDGAAPAAI